MKVSEEPQSQPQPQAEGSPQEPSSPPPPAQGQAGSDPRQVIAALLAAAAAERQRSEQALLQAEIEKRISQLPASEQEAARERARAALALRQLVQGLAWREALARAELARRSALFEQVARQAAIQDIARQYQIDPQDIADYDTPEEMVRTAERLANARRADLLAGRAQGAQDAMPGPAAPADAFDRMSALDILTWYYNQQDRIRGEP